MKLGKKEMRALLSQEPHVGDVMNSLEGLSRMLLGMPALRELDFISAVIDEGRDC